MIITPCYKGQGLGNQLACYITTRCIALDNGYDFGWAFPENFKGKGLFNLEIGNKVDGLVVPIEGQPPTLLPEGIDRYYEEKSEKHPDGTDIRGYDEYLKNIPDRSCVHGLMQGEKYFQHRKNEIGEWLKVEPLAVADNLCVINFRGGEYKYDGNFFLFSSYWKKAIEQMLYRNPNLTFEVHTDDEDTARSFFPDFPVIHDIGLNWRSVRHAKYLILSNSSFGWFPAWLNKDAIIYAPWGWGRYNKDYWSLKQNQTKKWNYVKPDGTVEFYFD